MSLFKVCPQCGAERPSSEAVCEGDFNGVNCGWDLVDQPIKTASHPYTLSAPPRGFGLVCAAGHNINEGDAICLACGQDLTEFAAPQAEIEGPTLIDGWEVQRRLTLPDESSELFEVRKGETSAVLTLYRVGAEPDTSVQSVRQKIDPDHIPALLDTGRYQERAYEVCEFIRGTSLEDAPMFIAGSEATLRRIADELGRALRDFSELGLRHREISPKSILIRSEDPLDLVITRFGSARLSDYDLESVSPLEVNRYSAPETIVGGVSVASDWWSLGVILLEHLTSGDCFTGINDKAFQIHVVTRGIPIPQVVQGAARVLLRGLLTRDPLRRWKWPEVSEWLEGRVPDLEEERGNPSVFDGVEISLAARRFRSPELYALVAAEAENWQESKGQLIKGAVATWLDNVTAGTTIASAVRSVTLDDRLGEDERHALALMHMNQALPLIFIGEIVSPAWLLKHPEEGYALIDGPVPKQLSDMGRERWIARLSTRLKSVRDKAGQLQIELDEARLRIAALSTSRANMDAERALLRKLYPEAQNDGLASIMEHDRPSDEELLILVTAKKSQFIPLEALVEEAAALATQYSIVSFNQESALDQLMLSRRDIYQLIDKLITGFARCAIPRIDEWVDRYRIERRMPLPRAALILSIPLEAWQEPPRQQYVSSLLDHFAKKVDQSIQQGPLVRFIIGKTTGRVDMLEVGSGVRTSDALLDHILRRGETPINIDPEVFARKEGLLTRFRRMISHTQTFRRETGIDGMYMAFPFLVTRAAAAGGERRSPRIAPVLLWPVVVDLPSGHVENATVAFDKLRESVRLNPALAVLLSLEELERFRKVRDEILSKSSLHYAEVVDLFGCLIPPTGRELGAVPSNDTKLKPGERRLVCSAAFFNAEFTGQAIGEDLRHLRHIPPTNTALETALRVRVQGGVAAPLPTTDDRYHVVEADPSQEVAVLRAREKPGLLVEGPPGTGKSQTIVNIVADSIARNETILVVCQKQVALKVVQKRLEAEGLGGRLVSVVDPTRDRTLVVRSLREQAEALLRSSASLGETLRRTRKEIANQAVLLESDLNAYHGLLHKKDAATGFTYRQLLCALINVGTQGPAVSLPSLRQTLSDATIGQVETIEDQCSALAGLWLRAKFEGSPLTITKSFAADEGVVLTMKRHLTNFARCELNRQDSLKKPAFSSGLTDVRLFRGWLDQHKKRFSSLVDERWKEIARWIEFFKAPSDRRSAAEQVWLIARDVAIRMRNMDVVKGHENIRKVNESLSDEELEAWICCSEIAARKVSILGKLSWKRFRNRRRLKQWLKANSFIDVSFGAYSDLVFRERDLRSYRTKLRKAANEVRWTKVPELTTEDQMASFSEEMAEVIGDLRTEATALLACPALREAEQMVSSSSKAAYDQFVQSYEATLSQHLARESSKQALEPLKVTLEESWIDRQAQRISSDRPPSDSVRNLLIALGTLPAFQKFRARASNLNAGTITAFKELRTYDQELVALSPDDLASMVRRTIRKEALLAWKSRAEHAQPDLLCEREEIEAKQRKLGVIEAQLRERNRELLEKDIDPSELGTLGKWEDITRLTGVRSKRLREIFDEGQGIGLLRMRPVWMMTPDVVSQMLPLTAKLFDVVVFDEASQLLVEYAVPSMFRAGRAVVSGDDKQMPPTSFFSSRTAEEDEDVDLSPDDYGSDDERDIVKEKWDRREIKDCPDLLALAAGCFPATTLRIHYRSKYRELIAFSNYAFYKGELSVPAKHPDKEVVRAKPIRVVRVDGVYQSQTNPEEADRVVNELARIWGSDTRPSTCVVTFNKKQADLVEEAIENRATKDRSFLNAYNAEKIRIQDGEDMRFMVRNVENIQGDERDVVIFSTTFGRNELGSFRRAFGALGQKGGERRLNVAVTRARIQVILITSMPISDVSDMLATGRPPSKPRDFLQGYLDYSSKVSAGDLETARSSASRLHLQSTGLKQAAITDPFVSIVESHVRSLGLKVVRGDGLDTFSVDLAVESANAGHYALAIECDSPLDRAGHLVTARARDVWRPRILKRAIPFVHRVSSHGWYHDGPGERARLDKAVQHAMAVSS